MLLRVIRRLTSGGQPCIISVRDALPAGLASSVTAPVVADAYGDVGPLGGLASAAARVTTPLLFAAAADLPALDADLIETLARLRWEAGARTGIAPQAVVPRHPDGTLEPLAALYETAALVAGAARALALGRKKVTDALEGLRVSHYEIAASDAGRFANVNTAHDLAALSGQ